MDRDGARPRVNGICRSSWPTITAIRDRFFERAPDIMGEFFLDMLSQPLIFTRSQADFHMALDRQGAIQPTSHINNVPIFTYLGDPFPESGNIRVDLAAFIDGFCRLLLDTDMLANHMQSILELPSRVVRSAFFFSMDQRTFPMRTFFLERFFAATSPERDAWTLPGYAYAQTMEMVDLAFMDAVVREANPIALSEQSKNRLRMILESAEYATFDTTNGAIQRTMEMTSARCIMCIYSYFVHRIASTPTGTNGVLYDTITTSQRYFELMFCMLMGYDVSDVVPLLAAIPPHVLMVVSQVAEEVRSFLRDPINGGNALIRSVYHRTVWFDRVYQANQQVRNVIIASPEARRELTLFYVPCYDVGACELVSSLCEQFQVLQMRALYNYMERLPNVAFGLRDMVTTTSPARVRESINNHLYACNFGGGVHLHRVLWTVAHYAAMVPMLATLREETYVGLDAANRVYMIMPRTRMEQLRLVMFADAATMRNYRKPTAIYPLLLRLYMSTRGTPDDVSLDHMALLAVGSVLGYWLCIPASEMPLVREGMPRIGQHPGTLALLHDAVALIYKQAIQRHAPAQADTPQEYQLVQNISAMNAIRSFMTTNAPHHMSMKTARKLRDVLRTSVEHRNLIDALEVLMDVNGAHVEVVQSSRRGRPRRSALIEPSRLRTDALMTEHARGQIMRRDRRNLLAVCAPERVVPTFNLWMYTAILYARELDDAMRYDLMCDYCTVATPLDENFWRNKYTNYSPEVVNTWTLASDYLCHAPPNRYCHNTHSVRRECNNAAQMHYFILFLQQFERLVCLPSSRSVSRTGATTDTALIRWLTDLYGNQERLMQTMPVSAYYDSSDQRHHTASFEASMAIAEVMPSTAAQSAPISQTPTMCVHDYRSTQLSQTAIDLAMAFGNEFRESDAVDPALCGRVRAQISEYATSAKVK